MESRVTRQGARRVVQDADLWRDFRGAFKTLVDEQRTLIRAKQQDRRLRACWNYDSDLTQLESDLLQRGLICWRYSLQSGRWKLGEGPNEDLRARFETLATRAGIELHPPDGIAPLDFWLHRVYLYLQQTRSRDFFLTLTVLYAMLKSECEDHLEMLKSPLAMRV
jgi:hypothetical protein